VCGILASEIKTLLLYPGAHRGFHEARVLDYLRDGRIDEGDETLFEGVMAVPPASYLELTADQKRVTRFWHLDAQPERVDPDPARAVARLQKPSQRRGPATGCARTCRWARC
jgi:asparagine synthetase B (glutamine-hydrolysing)